MLSENQKQHRCLIYQGSYQCRYAVQRSGNWKNWNCVKKVPGKKRAADKKANEYIAEMKKHHRDPLQSGEPIGDSCGCQGFSMLPTVLQGYDVKPKS